MTSRNNASVNLLFRSPLVSKPFFTTSAHVTFVFVFSTSVIALSIFPVLLQAFASVQISFPTRSSDEVESAGRREFACLYLRITSRKVQKRFPCSGFVKKSVIICSVGQCRIVTFAVFILSFIQKNGISMCLDFGLAEACPFFSIFMGLSFSCSK
jgi:hypothetical protein